MTPGSSVKLGDGNFILFDSVVPFGPFSGGMKVKNGCRASVLLALACLIAFSAESRAAAKPYIGLYVDATHSMDRQDVPYPYTMFDAWVWVLPSYYGMICTDFKLAAPNWLLQIGITVNPDNSVTSGAPFGAEGASICFPSCRRDWTWLYQLRMLAVTANVPGYIEFVEYVEHYGSYDVKFPL